MLRGWLWDWLVIISVTAFTIGLMLQGFVPFWLGTLAIITLIILRAAGRGWGGGLGRAVRRTFTVAMPIIAILILAITYSGGNTKDMLAITSQLGALCIALLGLYIIIRGLFPR